MSSVENIETTVEATLREAARLGAEVAMGHFRRLEGVTTKGSDIDLQTVADVECERAIVGLVRERHPDHAIVAEESDSGRRSLGDAEWAWLIDPIDGTTNFAHGAPWFGMSLGVWRAGDMFLGLVMNPPAGDVYFARRGAGATLNDRPIRVCDDDDLATCLLVSGFPYDRRERVDYYLAQWRAALQASRGVRRLGAASVDMGLVAAGVFGAYWESSLHPWDWAAGALIVQEAGGRVTDFEGRDFDLWQNDCLATNGRIHEQMLELLNV